MAGVLLALCVQPVWAAGAEADGHHPHHVELAAGIARTDSRNSAYLGADERYSWQSGWGIGGFYKEANRNFDLQVIGHARPTNPGQMPPGVPDCWNRRAIGGNLGIVSAELEHPTEQPDPEPSPCCV